MNGPPDLFDASGAFETCRVRKGQVLHLKEHLARLGDSLRTLGFSRWEEGAFRSGLLKAARGLQDGYVRIAVRRGGRRGFIIHRREGIPYSKEQRERGVSVTTVPTRAAPAEAVQARVKSSERLSGVLARLEAPAAEEVLRLGPQGYLTEGTISNLFLVKNGVIRTPPPWAGVLEGVTRARLIQAAHRLRISVKEVPLTRHDLFNAEEAFLTNVLMGILPIRRADGRAVGRKIPGPVTARLMAQVCR